MVRVKKQHEKVNIPGQRKAGKKKSRERKTKVKRKKCRRHTLARGISFRPCTFALPPDRRKHARQLGCVSLENHPGIYSLGNMAALTKI